MATLLKTDGTKENVYPKNGKSFDLDELQGFVGGYIELVTLNSRELMFINEEGKIHGLALNQEASYLFWLAGGDERDVIVGPAVVMSWLEADEEDDGGGQA